MVDDQQKWLKSLKNTCFDKKSVEDNIKIKVPLNLTYTPIGTCQSSGYSECCSGGYCAGNPTTCFCDAFCRNRGDCCSDIDTTCPFPDDSSCSAAGHDTCCTSFLTTGCVGVTSGPTCYCDSRCRANGDCCRDINITCPRKICTHTCTVM